MKETDLARISHLRIFEGMEPNRFSDLTSGAFMQKFPAGTTLLYEGDSVDFLYILFDGRHGHTKCKNHNRFEISHWVFLSCPFVLKLEFYSLCSRQVRDVVTSRMHVPRTVASCR